MTMMKAIRPSAPDASDPSACAKVETVSIPDPAAGEYQVQLKLRPVNPADVFSLMGIYPGCQSPEHWPITMGLDGMGIITKAGPGTSKFEVGQRVAVAGFPLKEGNGTWAEYAAFKETDLVGIPDGVSDEAAAVFWVNPVTAYGMVRMLQLPKGAHVVVNAAGSALGGLIGDVARHMGLKTIGVVRRDAQVADVLARGLDACVSSEHGADVAKAIRDLTPNGEGAYAALECVGGAATEAMVAALRPGGTLVIYGAMAGLTSIIAVVPICFFEVTVRGFWINNYVAAMGAAEKEELINDVVKLLADGVMRADKDVGKVFRLEDAAAAVRESSKPARGGKVFLDSR